MASSAKRRSKGSKASDGKRKRKYSGSDEDGPAYLSSKYAEPPTSKIYNNRFKQSNHPDQLFRADLISAMKMPDSEPLAPEEYVIIEDSWRTDWERGVQVPVNPDTLPEPTFRIFRKRNKDAHYKQDKKLIRFTRDSHFDPSIHVMSYMNTLAEQICRYDMDSVDFHWLTSINQDREDYGLSPVEESFFEQVIEEFEVQAYVNFQEAIKSEEGLGVEYDEDAICDVCRSPDSQENNEMVFCDSCNICVHQICYGITKIPEGSWICRTCALGIRPACVLCPNRGGAMKTLRCGQKWAHVGCAVWIPGVSFFNFIKMEPIIKISQIPAGRWALICSICNVKTGACILCSEKNCKVAFHVTCAFNEGLQMRACVKNAYTEDDELRAFCKKHSNKRPGMFSDSEEEHAVLKRDSLSNEERANLRQLKISEKEAEFYNYVSIDDIAEQFECDKSEIESIFYYWKLKRRANANRPLLTPRVQNLEKVTEEENSPFTFMKKLVLRRRDLERARNLCYMVKNREKLVKKWLQAKEEIFNKQVSILRKQRKKLTEDQLNAVLNANCGDLAYDKKYSGVNGPSPNMVSVLTNLVGEDSVRTKVNGQVKPSKKNENRNSVKTPNPYAKHYLNGLLVRTQRFLSTANKQRKVQFQSDTSCQEETDNSNCNFQCDATNSVSCDVPIDSDRLSHDQHFSSETTEIISNKFSEDENFQNTCASESSHFSKNCEENASSSSITSPETDTRLCSAFDKSIVETDSGIDNTNGDVDSANSPAELNFDSNVVIETAMQSSDSEKSFDEINFQSNVKLEDKNSIYISNDVNTVNIKLEESEVIYMPDFDVGANYKMEQTDDALVVNEVYNPCDTGIKQFDSAYNPYDLNSDANVVIEDCIYDVEVGYSDTQMYIESDIVNNTNQDICDNEYDLDCKLNLQSTDFNSETKQSKDIKSDELSSVSCNDIKDKEQLDNSQILDNKCFKQEPSENSSLAKSSVENNSTLFTKTVSCDNSDVEAERKTSKEIHKIKPKKFKSASITKQNIKSETHKKINDLLISTGSNHVSNTSKEFLLGKLNVELEELNLNPNKIEDKKMETNANSTSNTNTVNFDTIEKTLKLEVKKNNNRVLPLPYVVLKSDDVVKCLKEGDSVKCSKKVNNVLSYKPSEGLDKLNQKDNKKTKVNGLVKKISPHDSNLIKKVKPDKAFVKGSPLRTNSPTPVKVSENCILKSSKPSKRKFNHESSSVFSKQPVGKLKSANNLSSVKQTSSTTKCQEKLKSSEKNENSTRVQEKIESNSKHPEKVENSSKPSEKIENSFKPVEKIESSTKPPEKFESSSSDSKSLPFTFDKTLPPIPKKDSFRGYKIPKKQPQTNKPEENSLDSRRGSVPLSPLPDITPVNLSGYQSKTSWRKLEPRSEKVTFNKPPPVRTNDMHSHEVPSERLVLKLTKDTTDPESMRWKADPNSFDRNNCRRNWNNRQVPPLMPPPFLSHLPQLGGGSWPHRANQVNFRPIHNNYSHGPFS
ncbi:uncharacterized protein [Parasteatoda tepidariorum]|uniref:uncharacterized protein n=1 Tax=Parasteatoda tepidariorum TaxID=114398 RepID=UPI001C71FF22|nr:uncharacterized protein LOC107437577 [Parasteatoda tepidariorum]XP_042907737.1 uncharacterized protein LOC107437577 [Parasteatoda tepidariorum]